MTRSRLLTDAYHMLATVGVSSGLGFAYWLVAARLHAPETFGTAAAVISAVQLVASLGLVNLPSTVLRFMPIAGGRARHGLLTAYSIAVGLSVLLATGFALLAFGGLFSVTGASVSSTPLAAAAFVLAAATWAVFFLQDAALLASGKSLVLPLENVVYGVVKLLLLVALRHHGAAGMVVSWFLPAAAATLPVNTYLFGKLLRRRQPRPGDVGCGNQEVRHFLLVGLFGYSATVAVSTAMPLVVSNFTDERQTAFFSAAWTLALVVDLFLAGFPTALMVQGSRAPEAVRHETRRMLRHFVPLVGAGVLGLALLGPVGLHFYGSEYASEGAAVLRWFAIGLAFRAARAVLVAIACVEHNIGIAVASDVTSAVLFIAVAGITLERQGIAGAGMAYTLANAAGLAVVWRIARPQLAVAPAGT